MSGNDPKAYTSRSTDELEDLLRRQDLPPKQQKLIRDELYRRYTGELLPNRGESSSPARAAQSKPQPSPQPSAQPKAPRPQQKASPSWTPPPPPVSRSRAASSTSIGSTLKGCLVAVILVVVGVVVALYWLNQNAAESGYGSTCVTPGRGVCPLGVAAPIGSTCTCTDGVAQYFGYVQ